jgi:hypothetical protein
VTDERERIINEAIEGTRRHIESALLGATTATYGPPQDPSLTYDRLLETFRQVPKVPPPLRVYEVPLYAVEVQARRHPRKKKRLQKKWLRRYGTRREYRRHFAPGQMFVDKTRGVVYAHAEEVRALKAQLPSVERGRL